MKNVEKNKIDLSVIWKNPLFFVACGFGVGTMPVMPGTFGTAMGVLIFTLLMKLPLWMYISIVTILFIIGVWICEVTNAAFGTEDHPAAVWDEIVGFLIVMIAVPVHWYTLLLGFIFFRLFDIWKPGPIRWIDQHIHGGWGVMMDDALAALFAWIILQGIVYLL